MIKLTTVGQIWDEKCVQIVQDLDGKELLDVESDNTNRSQKAEVSRNLLELADLLAMMEQLVRQEYWVMKNRGIDVEVYL